MQVDELLKPFPIKEFHPFPRALMGPGAHEMIGPEALKLGFRKTLVMTSGLRGTDIVHKIVESMKYHGLEVVVYDKVESNPKDYNVMDAVALYQENECDSFVSIGGAWAEVADTPLSYFKTTTYEGGTQVPLIVAGPDIARRGIDTTQMLHVTDVLPTILDFIGAARPDEWEGKKLAPIYGRSWKPYLTGESKMPIRGPFDVLGFEMMECRAIIKGDWKLLFMAPPYGNNDWHLFNLRDDPREMINLADAEPAKFAELKAEWEAYAAAVGYIEAGRIKQLASMSPEDFFRYEGLERRRALGRRLESRTMPADA